MNFTEVISMLDQHKNTHGIIPKRKFNTLFRILEVGDDGNCLFYSIEKLNSKYDYDELRENVCEYYKQFDKSGNYPEDSLKAKLQIQMISDNEEDDGTLHEDVICNDLEWGGIMDVIALADILKTNIVMCLMRKEGYTIQPFMYKSSANTIFVKYNGRDHFEPLLPKFAVKDCSKSASDEMMDVGMGTKRRKPYKRPMTKKNKSKSKRKSHRRR